MHVVEPLLGPTNTNSSHGIVVNSIHKSLHLKNPYKISTSVVIKAATVVTEQYREQS